MHLKTRNVNTAFRYFADLFSCKDLNNFRRTTSRNGAVMMIDEPVIVTYSHPRERVLFNSVRDANPFFHLYEALWMLAGRNDVAPVAYYAKNMLQFSDDDRTLNGAYGYRWRKAGLSYPDDTKGPDNLEVDQLDILVSHLKAFPDSRRAVLQMWNVEDDLLKIEKSLDVCCNLSVMFSLRLLGDGKGGYKSHLDMTVTNRSNDLVWGMLGANMVHFSFLQEYMAARLGVEVGVYNHISNNVHAYVERPDWKPQEWLECEDGEGKRQYHGDIRKVPLVSDPATFEKELPLFVEAYKNGDADQPSEYVWKEPFLNDVAAPMMEAFHCHKAGCPQEALEYASDIRADDWKIASTEWLNRRMKK